MMSDQIYVHAMLADGTVKLAGVFATQNGDGYFRYHKDWLKVGYQISFDLPFIGDVQQKNKDINQGVFGALRDAMPDFWGRMVASKTLKTPFEQLSVEKLMLSTDGFSQVGALSFQSTQNYIEPTAKPPQFVDLAKLCEAAKLVESNIKDIPPEYLMLLKQGSSMGGARPKTTIAVDGVLKLAKLPSERDTVNNARLEHACLTLADMCGLATPKHEVVEIENFGSILLLDRFDRAQDIKRHYQSALSLLQLDESENVYGGYPLIAKEMRKNACSVNDVNNVFRHMTFNALIRNTDDHLRNHGFLMSDTGKWELSPIFDLAPSTAIAGVGREFFSSINIGEQGRVASIQNLLSNCHDFLLDASEAENIVNKMAETITNNWQQVFSDNCVDTDLFSGCFDNDFYDSISYAKKRKYPSFG